jgi:hypothetical protein
MIDLAKPIGCAQNISIGPWVFYSMFADKNNQLFFLDQTARPAALSRMAHRSGALSERRAPGAFYVAISGGMPLPMLMALADYKQ